MYLIYLIYIYDPCFFFYRRVCERIIKFSPPDVFIRFSCRWRRRNRFYRKIEEIPTSSRLTFLHTQIIIIKKEKKSIRLNVRYPPGFPNTIIRNRNFNFGFKHHFFFLNGDDTFIRGCVCRMLKFLQYPS